MMTEPITSEKYKEFYDLFNSWLAAEDEQKRFKTVLGKVCNYSLRTPGKRIRPVLALAVAEMLEIEQESVKPFALALEYVHGFSLIHDDLPALDNDELRRGQATAHIAFGEAEAILAGDALQARAFELVAKSDASAEVRCQWVVLLSETIVSLCEGQALDIKANASGIEHSHSENSDLESSAFEQELTLQHSLKTAALIKAALVGPTFLAGDLLSENLRQALGNYGSALGLLFQITDDILDGQELPGYQIDGSAVREANYFSLFGLEAAREMVGKLVAEAKHELLPFGDKAKFLNWLCDYVAQRQG